MVVIFSVNGCGPQKNQKVNTEPGKQAGGTGGYIFYPPLPNTPRYQYLTRFSTSKDIRKKKSKFFKFVAGNEQEKPIKIIKPNGIDIYDGVIYVCDVGAGVLVMLDLKTRTFGYLGATGNNKLVKPVNLKIDRVNKKIFVADMGRRQVMAFNLEGNFLKAYGKKG
jgi:hypothetical protein